MADKPSEDALAPTATAQKPRYYHIDWARSMSVHAVLWVHTIFIAMELRGYNYPNVDKEEPDRSLQLVERVNGALRVMLHFGIPMFFYISGFSVTFFNTEKKHFGIYLWDKIKRLILPLLFAFFFLLIPRNYLDQRFSLYGRPDGHNPQWDFFQYYADVLPFKIILKIGWLWFLPALFIDSMMAYPLLKWSQRRYAGKSVSLREDGALILAQTILVAIWSTVTSFIIPKELRIANNLPSDIALYVMILIYYFVPHKLIKRENGYKYSLLLRLIGPIGAIILCQFKDGHSLDQLYTFASMINFDLVFMAQGMIDQIYHREQKQSMQELSETLLVPLLVFLWFIQYSVCTPTAFKGQGLIIGYPMYQDTEYQIIHVIGTWSWLYGIMLAGPHLLNSKFNEKFYDFFIGQSMYVYISHYFWLLVAVQVFIDAKMHFWSNVFVLLLVTEIFMIISYLIIQWIYKVVVFRKLRGGLDSQSQKPQSSAQPDQQTPNQAVENNPNQNEAQTSIVNPIINHEYEA